MTNQELIDALRQAIVDGDEEQSALKAKAAVEAGVDPSMVIKQAINEPMEDVGKSFQDGDIFLPEVRAILTFLRYHGSIVPISFYDHDYIRYAVTVQVAHFMAIERHLSFPVGGRMVLLPEMIARLTFLGNYRPVPNGGAEVVHLHLHHPPLERSHHLRPR